VTGILAPAGFQPAAGQPAVLLRANTALSSALRCTFTAGTVTVVSASMMFDDDRPLQIYVRPQSGEAMRGVCEVLARHADRLDRLDHEACVAELLAHVESVRFECETSGLVPTVATMQAGTVRLAPRLPAWPEPAAGPLHAPYEGAAAGLADTAARVKLNAMRRAGAGDLIHWELEQFDVWPRLLSKDRRGNLQARLASYDARGLLKGKNGIARTIDGGRHAVWFPDGDDKGAFAHSIGLYYLYNLPEILLVDPTPAAADIGARSRALAAAVDAIAAAMAMEGTRIKPGDRYGLVADAVARAAQGDGALEHERLAESRFVLPSRRLEERTLGAASWFYANFMDVLTYPVLACLLRPAEVAPATEPAAAEVIAPAAEAVEPAAEAIESTEVRAEVAVVPEAAVPEAADAEVGAKAEAEAEAAVETTAAPAAQATPPAAAAAGKRKTGRGSGGRKRRGKTKR
jgi:hypothetical protein